MNEKELREIKRRFRPERSNIPNIVGCFVNENKQIVSKITQSIAQSESIVAEKLLSVMKKTLTGALGTNLNDIPFSTKQVLESPEHKLLTALVKSSLSDAALLDSFYRKVIDSVELESNYVILLAKDTYDVPTFSKDGESSDSGEVFSYIVAAVCPVKSMPEALSFRESDSLFHTVTASALLSRVELGFMFPTFEDRKTNIYNALYYTRSLSESYPAFVENIFASAPPMPQKAQRTAFCDCLTEALSEECSFEVVKAVHKEIGNIVLANKEAKDEEPITVSRATVKEVLSGCGIAEEKIERVGEAFDESFGKNAYLSPKNVIETKKFELSMPEVKIKVSPEYSSLVSTQIINNEKYILIKVTGDVEVNGINIALDEEE